MSYRCCKECTEAGRTSLQSARYHADKAERRARVAMILALVSGGLSLLAVALRVVSVVTR